MEQPQQPNQSQPEWSSNTPPQPLPNPNNVNKYIPPAQRELMPYHNQNQQPQQPTTPPAAPSQPQPQQPYYPYPTQQPQYPPQQQAQPYYYPQPQQQPYYGYGPQMPPPPQVNVIVSNTNVANASASANVRIRGGRRPIGVASIIYFCLIGWWLGLGWVMIALMLCCTLVGIPAGMKMLGETGRIMFAI